MYRSKCTIWSIWGQALKLLTQARVVGHTVYTWNTEWSHFTNSPMYADLKTEPLPTFFSFFFLEYLFSTWLPNCKCSKQSSQFCPCGLLTRASALGIRSRRCCSEYPNPTCYTGVREFKQWLQVVLMCTLGGSSEPSSSWISVTHVGGLDWVPGSWLLSGSFSVVMSI